MKSIFLNDGQKRENAKTLLIKIVKIYAGMNNDHANKLNVLTRNDMLRAVDENAARM